MSEFGVNYYAFVGDWNIDPFNPHRFSTTWLAKKADGVVTFSRPAKHGRIDHVVTNALVRSHGYVSGGGSDHDLHIISLAHPVDRDRVVRIGYWNVRRDRVGKSRTQMFTFLEATIKRERLDVVCLQEISDYREDLRKIYTEAGWAWVGAASGMHRHNCVMVAPGVKTGKRKNLQLSKKGWMITQLNPPRERAPLGAPIVEVDGWLAVLSHHGVVHVDVTAKGLKGGEHRVVVWRQSMRRLARLGRRIARGA